MKLNTRQVKRIGKIVVAIGSMLTGLIIGGNVLYNDGLYTGGVRVYDTACEIYPDFKDRVMEYTEDGDE